MVVISLLSCNEFENSLKMEAKELHNTEFIIYKGTNEFKEFVNDKTVNYSAEIAKFKDDNLDNCILKHNCDSLNYNYLKGSVEIDYFHLSSGCMDFIPKLVVKKNYLIIKCQSIYNESNYVYESGVLKFVGESKGCKNIMHWKINISNPELVDKKIYFMPKKNEIYELVQK